MNRPANHPAIDTVNPPNVITILRLYVSFLLLIAFFQPALILAQPNKLRLAGMFSNHMVLQRGIPLKIWGTAKPGTPVKVAINGSSAETKTDSSGSWLLTLPAQKAGGPYELKVTGADEILSVQDVLVGDVWVCSGQSNMDFPLRYASNAKSAISDSSNNKLRFYNVPKKKSTTPLTEFEAPGKWEVSSPATSGEFSAVGYFFGAVLQRELDVPIGLIESTWGGTRVDSWTPLTGLKSLSFGITSVEEMQNALPEDKYQAAYETSVTLWQNEIFASDPGSGSEGRKWYSSDFDDSSWKDVTLPGTFEDMKMPKYDGSFWYRKKFDVSEDQARSTATFTFVADDADNTFLNGVRIGSTDLPNSKRTYEFPADALTAGINTIAIQLWDWGGPGGLPAESGTLTITFTDSTGTQTTQSLTGSWKGAKGVALNKLPGKPTPPTIRPTVLYNAMIAPMQNYGIKGFTWYQGESNARVGPAEVYDEALCALISEWRKGWNLGDLPFFQVQLASFTPILKEPAESDWAILRESQERVMTRCENTAMASAIDVGEENDIHPRDKATVGKRLVLNALAVAYERDIQHMGPVYKSHSVVDGKVKINFTNANNLVARGSGLKGFSICGPDKKFMWANAEIIENQVVVSSPAVAAPVAVRYGWANFSTGNLYNEAGLPASPFRTDRP